MPHVVAWLRSLQYQHMRKIGLHYVDSKHATTMNLVDNVMDNDAAFKRQRQRICLIVGPCHESDEHCCCQLLGAPLGAPQLHSSRASSQPFKRPLGLPECDNWQVQAAVHQFRHRANWGAAYTFVVIHTDAQQT